jgi:hypothetical protein
MVVTDSAFNAFAWTEAEITATGFFSKVVDNYYTSSLYEISSMHIREYSFSDVSTFLEIESDLEFIVLMNSKSVCELLIVRTGCERGKSSCYLS